MSALHAPYPSSSTGSLLLPTLKGVVTASTLFVAGGMSATSLQFVPALIAAAKNSVDTQPGGMQSGRLTPQPGTKDDGVKDFLLAVPDSNSWPAAKQTASSGHKSAAQQFNTMSKTAFASQVPFEILSIVASGYLAYYYRSHRALSPHLWKCWAGVAGLITVVFPYTGIMMVPYDTKLARIAGVEEQIETYEDSPPDHEAEKSNTVEFLTKWNALNGPRAGIMFLAGSLGLYTLLA